MPRILVKQKKNALDLTPCLLYGITFFLSLATFKVQ